MNKGGLQSLTQEQKLCQNFLLMFLAGWIVCWGIFSSALTIQYSDSFALLINAKSMAYRDGQAFSWLRPPLLSLILTPAHYLPQQLSFLMSKLLCVGMSAGFLWMAYAMFRLYFSSSTAVLGVLLLALNRIVIHYTPFVKEDILAALLLNGGFLIYLKSFKKRRFKEYVIIGLLFLATVLTRYNYLVLLFPLIILHEFLMSKKGKVHDAPAKVMWWLAVPFAGFLIIPSILSVWLGLATPWQAPVYFIKQFFATASLNYAYEPMGQNIQFLGISSSWMVCLLAAAGLAECVVKRRKEFLFVGAWLLLFFAVQTAVIGHKEARYLLSVLVPLYMFALHAIGCLLRVLKERTAPFLSSKTAKIASQAIVILALLPAFGNGYDEVARFHDPVYQTSFISRIKEAASAQNTGKIFWVGELYPIVPRQRVFHEEDEFFYIYHLHGAALAYQLGRPVWAYHNPSLTVTDDVRQGVLVHNVAMYADDGDMLIINLQKSPMTKTLPKTIQPLVLERVRKIRFTMREEYQAEQGVGKRFAAREWPGAQIVLREEAGGAVFIAQALPVTSAEIYAKLNNQDNMKRYKPVDIHGGQVVARMADLDVRHVEEMILVDVTNVQTIVP